MRERLRSRGEELAQRWPQVATAVRRGSHLLGICVVFVAVAVLVGYAFGAPGPTGPPPTVDFDGEAAAVVADASERLEYRPYTVESWTKRVDYRHGSVSGGRFYRLHVEPSRGQLRGSLQPAAGYGDYGFRGGEAPEAIFATVDGPAWVRPANAGAWLQSPPAAALAADARKPANLSRERLADANLTVLAENETSFVAGTADTRTAGFETAGSVRFVVAKGENPHLREVRIVQRSPTAQATRLLRVVDRGETVAVRPVGIPPTTVGETLARIERGWSRLLP